MSQPIDYPNLVQEALRQVVRRVLTIAAESAPGSFHLYVGFNTRAPGVELPAYLRDLFPEEMRIVLQHQFWDLEVDDDGFSVMLSFNASRHRLRVPFSAMTAFYDADQDFALRFAVPEPPGETTDSPQPAAEPGETGGPTAEVAAPSEGARITKMRSPKRKAPAAAPAAETETPAAETETEDTTSAAKTDAKKGAKVVSLDAFRKK